jgi:hypothetical protein
MIDLSIQPEAMERTVRDEILWANSHPQRTLGDSEEAIRRVWRAALAAREEPQADSLSDFSEESLEALRDLVMPLEELPNSDRLLRLIDKALEVKRRGL